jgi:hypothetical protein
MSNIPVLSTIKQFCEKYPAFTQGGLRDRIFYADSNGLKKYGAILRDGRKVLIDEHKFFQWLLEFNA